MPWPTFSVEADVRDPLWSIAYPVGVITGHPYPIHVANLALFNKTGSGRIVRVLRATCSDQAAATTTVPVALTWQRCSAAVLGLGMLTPMKLDQNNDALPAGVKVYDTPSDVTLTASTVFANRIMVPKVNEITALRTLNDASRPLATMFEWIPGTACQKLVLREGEGICLHTSGAMFGTHAVEVTIRFRKASNGHTYQVRSTTKPDSYPLIALLNESGSGVVLEVTKLVVQEQGTDAAPQFTAEAIDGLDETTGLDETPMSLGGDALPPGIILRRRCQVVTGGFASGAVIPFSETLMRGPGWSGAGPGLAAGLVSGLGGLLTVHMGSSIRRAREPRYEIVLREGQGFAWISRTPANGGAFNMGFHFTVEPSIDASVYPIEDDVQQGITYGQFEGQFEGDLVVPVPSDVKLGVGYGADGTEFTGTYGGGGPSGPTDEGWW